MTSSRKTAPQTAAVAEPRLEIIFNNRGNSDSFTMEGWSPAEKTHRWSIGDRSVIGLPPLDFDRNALITIEVSPYIPAGGALQLTILFNDREIDRFTIRPRPGHYGFIVPRGVISADRDNLLTFLHPDAASPVDYGGYDDRRLALSMQWLRIEPAFVQLLGHPELLPPSTEAWDSAECRITLAERFQSLGQNCEFGLFQRKCGTEPPGLLRFSSIVLPALVRAIATRFEGIDHPGQISFSIKSPGGEYIGRHKTYGLDYHTFRREGAIDIDKFSRSESARMGYLARMLMEQVEGAEKIFVVQRQHPNLTFREILVLLQTLRAYNSRTALLWVTVAEEDEKDRVGKVERMGEGLFHGFIDRLAPGEDAHDFSFDAWMKLCSATASAAAPATTSSVAVGATPQVKDFPADRGRTMDGASTVALNWLPTIPDLRAQLQAFSAASMTWDDAVRFANSRLDFVQTNILDRIATRSFGARGPSDLQTKPVRLAILGSSTLSHLPPAIRIGGLRRGLWVDVYAGEYGQYWQELSDEDSGLHRFRPEAILFVLDGVHLTAGIDARMSARDVEAAREAVFGRLRACWKRAKDAFGAVILQQTPLIPYPSLLGSNDHRLPGARAQFLWEFNHALRGVADASGVEILAIDRRAATDGLGAWHDEALWHRSKHEVSPVAAPIYGDLVARILAAKQGRSSKCLVLDLDNTVWGGVIGDDGLDGIELGSGTALGETYLAFQEYCRELARRGVILAVCSKNDENNAFEAFDKHPEMILRRADISCFVANWNDKASNIRAIAEQLNIGLDSLVFVDDNPFERSLVRQELPMVQVPELSDDPADFPARIAGAGYFEALAVTSEDSIRTETYRTNQERAALLASSTDLKSYLDSLDMNLAWKKFDDLGFQRIVQLINKTNQFNLTTRRYTDDDVRRVMADKRAVGLQLRLTDKFGDNGIIAIVIGWLTGEADLEIDTWLMSCRVLGRQVEDATLNVLAKTATQKGARRLIGIYRPTAKNEMVRRHYPKLGFSILEELENGEARYSFDLSQFAPAVTAIEIIEAA